MASGLKMGATIKRKKKEYEIDLDPPRHHREELQPIPPRAESRGHGCNIRNTNEFKALYTRMSDSSIL